MIPVSTSHGYGSQLRFDEDSRITFSDVTTETDSNKPFVLNMPGGGMAGDRGKPGFRKRNVL